VSEARWSAGDLFIAEALKGGGAERKGGGEVKREDAKFGAKRMGVAPAQTWTTRRSSLQGAGTG